MTDQTLSNLAHEDRRLAPPAELAAPANVTAETYAAAEADPVAFWGEEAGRVTWDTEPTETLDWSNPPFAKWFADGTLNAAYKLRWLSSGSRRATDTDDQPAARRFSTNLLV